MKLPKPVKGYASIDKKGNIDYVVVNVPNHLTLTEYFGISVKIIPIKKGQSTLVVKGESK